MIGESEIPRFFVLSVSIILETPLDPETVVRDVVNLKKLPYKAGGVRTPFPIR